MDTLMSTRFEALKLRLMTEHMVALPSEKGTSILDCDASNYGRGLYCHNRSQQRYEFEKMIAYSSRTISKPEQRYKTTRKELLSIPLSPPPTLLETSASYLMNTSLFPTRSHLYPNLAITISVSFAVFVHTSIPKQPPPSPLPLLTSSSNTATLFITTCSSVRSPGFNRSRTLLHVLLSKLPNSVTLLPSSGFYTG